MNQSELSELIADVKEQVLYLQELGVESLAVEWAETAGSRFKVQGSRAERVQSPKSKVQGSAEGNVQGSGFKVQGLGPEDSEVERVVAPTRAALVIQQPSQRQQAPPGSKLASLPSLSKRPLPASPKSDGAPINLQMPKSSDGKTNTPAFPPVPDNAPLIHDGSDENLFGEMPSSQPKSDDTIESIRAEIGECVRCPLYAGRKQIVHSMGNFDADLMFVGEAPGADEDEQGVPFIGRAGQLLTKIIESIGMKREDVFIGNINRCRPPGNRAPEPLEAATCRPFLLREVAVVKPKVIVVLGATAAHNLLQTKVPISKLRGNFQEYLGVKVMPTFHPAYLLRDPNKKREVWEDMKKVRALLG